MNCLVVLHERDSSQVSAIKRFFKSEKIPCIIRLSSTDVYEKRYYENVWEMWALAKEKEELNSKLKIKWFILGDDDTFWFLEHLLLHLEPFQFQKPIYLGDITDALDSRKIWGEDFAYGGGGIVLSRGLVSLLQENSRDCEFQNKGIGGDAILGRCIQKLNVSLTRNSYFHQVDFSKDATGFFESGLQNLISLHHLQSWAKVFPLHHLNDTEEILGLLDFGSSILGSDFLRRRIWTDLSLNQSFVLTNGYSLTSYNRSLNSKELLKAERTWEGDAGVGFPSKPKVDNLQRFYLFSITRVTLNLYSFIYKESSSGKINSPLMQVFWGRAS